MHILVYFITECSVREYLSGFILLYQQNMPVNCAYYCTGIFDTHLSIIC